MTSISKLRKRNSLRRYKRFRCNLKEQLTKSSEQNCHQISFKSTNIYRRHWINLTWGKTIKNISRLSLRPNPSNWAITREISMQSIWWPMPAIGTALQRLQGIVKCLNRSESIRQDWVLEQPTVPSIQPSRSQTCWVRLPWSRQATSAQVQTIRLRQKSINKALASWAKAEVNTRMEASLAIKEWPASTIISTLRTPSKSQSTKATQFSSTKSAEEEEEESKAGQKLFYRLNHPLVPNEVSDGAAPHPQTRKMRRAPPMRKRAAATPSTSVDSRAKMWLAFRMIRLKRA